MQVDHAINITKLCAKQLILSAQFFVSNNLTFHSQGKKEKILKYNLKA